MKEVKTIVVSAVNLRKGGTLTILNDCLRYLASLSSSEKYRIVALVHKKEAAYYPEIEYIELPWTVRNWGLRLWCEYVSMHRLSKRLSPVYLWFSLHDTTPRVVAERQAMYCQTSFPFFRWSIRDLYFDYKIVLFRLFTKYAYRINVKSNKYVIVQQDWLKKRFGKMLHIKEDKFIIAPPEKKNDEKIFDFQSKICRSFLYASTPDCHKNFELLCRATELLEDEIGKDQFRVTLTVSGQENRYARWLHKKWRHVRSLNFAGFMAKEILYRYYEFSDCLIFPSKVETWGLPITEFMTYGKPMLLSDLPYAHETAAGSRHTAFFDPFRPEELKEMMKRLTAGDFSFLSEVKRQEYEGKTAKNWEELFDILLQE